MPRRGQEGERWESERRQSDASWRSMRVHARDDRAQKGAFGFQESDRRKRRSAHSPWAYGRSGCRERKHNRLRRRVKSPHSEGRIATEICASFAPLTCKMNRLAASSYFMVLRMPSQSVAPLKAFGLRKCPSWITSTQAPADRLMV